MMLRWIFCLFLFSYATAAFSQARTPPKSKHNSYFELIEAYTQRTMPGRRGVKPILNTHFIIAWEVARYPDSFYWRGDTGLVACKITKVHKVVKRSKNFPQGIDYSPESITLNHIHKGDTLDVTPVPTTKAMLPAGIHGGKNKALFFRAGEHRWIEFPVNNIGRKRDIAMP